jgi:hypothetical protein
MIYKKILKLSEAYKKYWFSYQNKKNHLKISWDSTFKQAKPINVFICAYFKETTMQARNLFDMLVMVYHGNTWIL